MHALLDIAFKISCDNAQRRSAADSLVAEVIGLREIGGGPSAFARLRPAQMDPKTHNVRQVANQRTLMAGLLPKRIPFRMDRPISAEMPSK